MRRWFAWFLGGLLAVHSLQAATPPPEERYGPCFYGIDLPETGARVLLVIDTSKSMGRKDTLRTDGGTRWMTLCDEVAQMTERMEELQRMCGVPYAVALLYEGGKAPHPGSELYHLSEPGARERLLQALSTRELAAGGTFEVTFGQTLWPLVAKHHITHLFYLGDNDIAAHGEAVRTAVTAWYALPAERPTPSQRPLWRQKKAWRDAWARWRPPAKRSHAFAQHTPALPPPPREVTFCCIAIGQASPFLQSLAEIGNGRYVERVKKRRRKR